MADPGLLAFEDKGARSEAYPHGDKPIELADRWYDIPPRAFALVSAIKGTVIAFAPDDELYTHNAQEALPGVEKWRVYSAWKAKQAGGPAVRVKVVFYRVVLFA